MSLKVIGVGLGRTGTNSLKLALEMLGFTRCHHMTEVFDHPEQAPGFVAAAHGESVDWEQLYEGYQACCDWPSCYFWRELSACYPEAKIILTTRDAESWYRSMAKTLIPGTHKAIAGPETAASLIGREIFLNGTFGGNIDDKRHVIEVYERHNQSVRDTIQPGRLLEFEARQGWGPLCTFLDVPVPETPYPHANALEEFEQNIVQRVP